MTDIRIIASIVVIGLLAACSSQQARPESYWDSHPKAALQRIEKCKANKRRLAQAIRTKPPEMLSALAKECKYLLGTFDEEAARKALGLPVEDEPSLLDYTDGEIEGPRVDATP